MKLSQEWKALEKPDNEIDQEELKSYLKSLYNGVRASHLNSAEYITEGIGWESCRYKLQADEAIDKLVAISRLNEFQILKNQFERPSLAGANRDNAELIKSSAEALCFLIESNHLGITNTFENAVKAATFNACTPGAANNMQTILAELQHSDYYDKEKFIKAKIAEKIREISKSGTEIHATEEIMYLLQNDYHTTLNRLDQHARFLNDPQTSSRYQAHRQFKEQLDQLVASREGVYEYVSMVQVKDIMDLPHGGGPGEFHLWDQEIANREDDPKLIPSEDLQKVIMLATKLDITTNALISSKETSEETDDLYLETQKDKKFTFKENFKEIIAAAITSQLVSGHLVDGDFISIERPETKSVTKSYNLSDPGKFRELMQEENAAEILDALIETRGPRLKKLLTNSPEVTDLFSAEQLSTIRSITEEPKPSDRQYSLIKSITTTRKDLVIELPEGWFIKSDDGFKKILDLKGLQSLTIDSIDIVTAVHEYCKGVQFDSEKGVLDQIGRAVLDKVQQSRMPLTQEEQELLMSYDDSTKLKIISDQALISKEYHYTIEQIVAMEPKKILLNSLLITELKKESGASTERIIELINEGADIFSGLDSRIYTALLIQEIDIMTEDSLSKAMELIENGADVNASGGEFGDTALHLAIASDKKEIVDIIRRKIDIRYMLEHELYSKDRVLMIRFIQRLAELNHDFRKNEDWPFRDINIKDNWSERELINDYLQDKVCDHNLNLNSLEIIIARGEKDLLETALLFKDSITLEERRKITERYGNDVKNLPARFWVDSITFGLGDGKGR